MKTVLGVGTQLCAHPFLSHGLLEDWFVTGTWSKMAWGVRMGQPGEVGWQQDSLWKDPAVGESMDTEGISVSSAVRLKILSEIWGWDMMYRDGLRIMLLKNVRTSVKGVWKSPEDRRDVCVC